MGTLQDAFTLAGRQVGLNERDQHAALQDYLKTGGASLDPAQTAWCAAFVNASLGQAGMQGTGSNLARSFMDWGEATTSPQAGDIAVFSRGDPNGQYGHVGFFEGYNPDGSIRVLGGNQGDAVSVSSYSPDRLLGFRRAAGGEPRNALAQAGDKSDDARNTLRLTDQRMDPAAFQTARPNALAQAQFTPGSSLRRYLNG